MDGLIGFIFVLSLFLERKVKMVLPQGVGIILQKNSFPPSPIEPMLLHRYPSH